MQNKKTINENILKDIIFYYLFIRNLMTTYTHTYILMTIFKNISHMNISYIHIHASRDWM